MRDINKVILIGRLGSDPVHKTLPSGASLAQFSIATHRRVGVDENAREETQWHRVLCWGKQGEACAQHLRKGNSVYVEGALQYRKWETEEGTKRTTAEIIAESVSFLSRNPHAAASDASSDESELSAADEGGELRLPSVSGAPDTNTIAHH